MGMIEIVSLLVIMTIGAAIPSSSVMLVAARSLTHGVSNGVSVSVGIVLGDIIFILLVFFGLSAIADSVAWLFLTIKHIGATYLIWLGLQLFLSKPTTFKVTKSHSKGNLVTSFFAGLLLTLGDIKAIFFYLSLLPAFVNLENLTFTDMTIVLLIDIFVVGGVKIVYALSAKKVAALSKRHDFENKTKKIAGSFMMGTGCYLFVKP